VRLYCPRLPVLHRIGPVAIPAAAVLFLLSGPLLGSTPDEEEYRNAILTMVLHARALIDGTYPYWTSALGFGLPHPLHPAMLMHPLLPLFGLSAPDTAVRVLYATHAALGAFGCWMLTRRVGGTRWAASIASATWGLSGSSVNYVLEDFWPTEFVAWSLAPFLLLAADRLLESEGRRSWIDALIFGIVSGLLVVNGHAGHTPVFFVALAVVFAVEWRRTIRVLPAIGLSALVAAAIASPMLVHLIAEVRRFPDVPRITAERVVNGRDLVDVVLRPIPLGASEGFRSIADRGARGPFFGGPLFLLAIAYALGLRPGPRRLGFLVAGVATFVLMAGANLNLSGPVSSMMHFRDPMTLFGIVLGSLALQTLAARSTRMGQVAGAIQVAVLLLAAYPFAAGAWRGRNVGDTFLDQSPATIELRSWADRLPGRWYLAPELDARVRRGELFEDGLATDSWVYRGLPVVNGLFKGASADPMYPSGALPLGRIEGHPVTVASAASLNVLGIGVVLATADEPVASSLVEVARVQTSQGPLRVFRNPGVWPGAAFVDKRLPAVTLHPLAGCNAAGVLCLDLTPVAALRLEGDVDVGRRHGVQRLRFDADPDDTRMLLLAEMYRRAWRARAGNGELRVSRVVEGLVAVEVPAGVREIELRYQPALLIALTWTSWGTLLAALGALYSLTRRRRTAAAATA
jgi:hypothetical protein